MDKNALFSLKKIAKITQRWGFAPQNPLPPAAGGFKMLTFVLPTEKRLVVSFWTIFKNISATITN